MSTQIYNNSNLPVSDADFESIKQRLIDFYKNTPEFKDYDFESSRMSQQMNMLAYVTLYNQQYSNTALFESFLRTAQTREGVVQNAQDKGYVPSSISASRTLIKIIAHTNGDDTPTSIDVPAGTKFIGNVDNLYQYTYINWENNSLAWDDTNKHYTANIEVVQGNKSVQYFNFDGETDIILFDKDVDTRYIKVTVTDNDGDTSGEYINWTSRSAISLSIQEMVFYVNESSDGYTRIYFGEGKLSETNPTKYEYVGGLKPSIGSTIKVEYLKTSGEIANGSKNFEFSDNINNVTIDAIIDNPLMETTWNGSFGGGSAESIEHIRTTASIFSETQNRCVTQYDYEAFIRSEFNNIVQAVHAFGSSDKPGYVFLAIKPRVGLSLNELQKTDMLGFLNQYNILTITPIIVQPDYLYVKHFVTVNYNGSAVPQGTSFLTEQIINKLDQYYIEQVEFFKSTFHVSKALKFIDESNTAIHGSNMNISLIIEVPDFYISATPALGISFMNPIYDVWSSTPLQYNIDVNSEPYDVNMLSINNSIVIGPFNSDHEIVGEELASGEYVVTRINSKGLQYNTTITVNNTIISETDQNDYVEDIYYIVGTLNKNDGTVVYDLNNAGLSDKIYVEQLRLEAATVRTDIYSKDGGLIVFEPQVRPEYLQLTLEQINND